ncbi:KCNH6 [Symbiodinium sp. CCMP2456]|nr:KCNH6 [Symbiodinium sp. CCMP2456]
MDACQVTWNEWRAMQERIAGALAATASHAHAWRKRLTEVTKCLPQDEGDVTGRASLTKLVDGLASKACPKRPPAGELVLAEEQALAPSTETGSTGGELISHQPEANVFAVARGVRQGRGVVKSRQHRKSLLSWRRDLRNGGCAMAARFRELLHQLGQEYETQTSELRKLRREVQRLGGDVVVAPESSPAPPFVMDPPGSVPMSSWDVRFAGAQGGHSAELQSVGLRHASRSQIASENNELGLNRSFMDSGHKHDFVEEIKELPKLPSKTSRAPPNKFSKTFTRQVSAGSEPVEGGKDDKEMKFSILRAQKTKNYIYSKPWYIINPDRNAAASAWQMVVGVCLIFVAVVTPFQVALLDLEIDAVLVMGLCVDFVFLIDMVLQFFTTFPKSTTHGIVWEVRLGKIWWHYLKSWFVLDLVTLIPFDLFTLAVQSDQLDELQSLKVFRTLRLVKIMRLAKSSQFMHKIEVPLSIPYQQMALTRFLLILAFVCHWLACLWAMTLGLNEDNIPTWIDGIEAEDLALGIRTRDSPWRVYLSSFYFCSYTLTSVGYGDIGPANILERFVCCVVILSAGLAWAYVIGEVAAIVHDLTAESHVFRKRMHHLNLMMRDQGLPHDLCCRLRSFFLQNRHQSLVMARQALLERMSPQLQSEVCIATNFAWLEKVYFFKKFMTFIRKQERLGMHTEPYQSCVAHISKMLSFGAFAQREAFTNVQVLYILSKGLVALNSRVRSHGEVWGEDFVLWDTSLIHPVTGYTLTYVEVLSLSREDLMHVIHECRFTSPELGQIVRRYCVRIAVYRGVLNEEQQAAIAEFIVDGWPERRTWLFDGHSCSDCAFEYLANPSGSFSVEVWAACNGTVGHQCLLASRDLAGKKAAAK